MFAQPQRELPSQLCGQQPSSGTLAKNIILPVFQTFTAFRKVHNFLWLCLGCILAHSPTEFPPQSDIKQSCMKFTI
jgi:hypothetical protein